MTAHPLGRETMCKANSFDKMKSISQVERAQIQSSRGKTVSIKKKMTAIPELLYVLSIASKFLENFTSKGMTQYINWIFNFPAKKNKCLIFPISN